MPACARWDASEIYGTTEERAALLRVGGTECELRVDEDGFMPLNATDGVPEGGVAHLHCRWHSCDHGTAAKDHCALCVPAYCACNTAAS